MGLNKLLGTAVLTTKKYSPEIKFIFGVISLGAALYTTHKSALKYQKILEEKKLALDKAEDEVRSGVAEVRKSIENGELEPEVYTEADEKKDYKKARMQVNVAYGFKMAKNYALPALFTGATVFFFHGAMMDYKNVAVGIGAAYNALLMIYKGRDRRGEVQRSGGGLQNKDNKGSPGHRHQGSERKRGGSK